MSAYVSAIIVAAGGSVRMGIADSKQFIPLLSRPAIEYTLKAFQNCYLIKEIIVVCREQDKERIQSIVEENGFSKVNNLVLGGASRAESVRNGVEAANENAKYYAIHDGARPLITVEEIERVVEAAFELLDLAVYVCALLKRFCEFQGVILLFLCDFMSRRGTVYISKSKHFSLFSQAVERRRAAAEISAGYCILLRCLQKAMVSSRSSSPEKSPSTSAVLMAKST